MKGERSLLLAYEREENVQEADECKGKREGGEEVTEDAEGQQWEKKKEKEKEKKEEEQKEEDGKTGR